MSKINWRTIQIGIYSTTAISLVLHLLFGILIYQLQFKPLRVERIEIQLVETPSHQNTLKPKRNEEVLKKQVMEKQVIEKQVVDQSEQALNDEFDLNTRFLSRHNQKVQKQTVARNRGEFNNQRNQKINRQLGSIQKKAQIDLKNFIPKLDYEKAVHNREQKEKEFDQNQEELSMQKMNNHAFHQNLVVASLDDPMSSSQTLDYIKDVDSGLETLLSTREFVFYTYYSRIRSQLEQYWEPRVKEKIANIYKHGRKIASNEDKITKCLITLDNLGNLTKIQIIGNSGIRELDEAAVESFKSAAPFPNPPAGMQDSDGYIKIRWDFVLEI